jgi:anti-sigma factor ChrR (cupin superfamily)
MDRIAAALRHLPGLVQGGWRDLDFDSFRAGVDIRELTEGYPKLALLRYAPGASVPRHLHTGLETILVLEGVQSDEAGDYPAGSLLVNPEGSVHAVRSETGCVVLIQWERPVRLIEDEDA